MPGKIKAEIEKRWRESPENPWRGWRRSYTLLATSFLLLALLPWLWPEARDNPAPSPEGILSEGRVGRAVLPGSSLFLDPFLPPPLRPTPALLLRPTSPLPGNSRDWPGGTLAVFDGEAILSSDIIRLWRAEKSLGGQGDTRAAILQRKIESMWLRREAELQGVALSEASVPPPMRKKLLAAGFLEEDIEERALALSLASALRSLWEARGGSLRDLEAEWVQRWSERTECGVELPICADV